MSAAAAFGILSKYNIIFLLLGLLPSVILTKHRKMFLNKNLYFSVVIGLIIVMPNLIWQYQNNFPTLYQLQDLARTQLVNVNRSDFIKEQFLFFSSSVIIIIASLFAFFVYAPFKKYRLFFWSYVFVLSIFIFLKAKSYYAIGLYPILIAFGSVYLEELLSMGLKKKLRIIVIMLVIGGSIPFFLMAFPIQSPKQIQENNQFYKSLGLLRWEDGKDHLLPQDFADMLGWTELARKTDSAYFSINDEEHTLVLCDNYGEAGAINYYSKIKNISAVSFNADYINWFRLNKKIDNIILIKESNDPGKKISEQFHMLITYAEIENPCSREKGTTIFILKNPKIDINKFLKNEIAETKRYP